MFSKRLRGFTLVEMIIAIVIISVGLAGVLLAFNSVRSSADPLIHKQMLAIAEEMMEEITLKPYAVTGVTPANAAVVCDAPAADRTTFNDVRDYNGYQTTGSCDIDGLTVSGLNTYNVRVVVATVAWQGIANSLQVTVTVTHGIDTLTLTGWRTNYAL